MMALDTEVVAGYIDELWRYVSILYGEPPEIEVVWCTDQVHVTTSEGTEVLTLHRLPETLRMLRKIVNQNELRDLVYRLAPVNIREVSAYELQSSERSR